MSLHRPLSQIDSLVIHCAATPNGRWTTVEDIDRWHGPDREARGLRPFLRRSGSPWQMPHLKHIGYHFVIYTSGAEAGGRGLSETGAHAIDRRAPKGREVKRRGAWGEGGEGSDHRKRLKTINNDQNNWENSALDRLF